MSWSKRDDARRPLLRGEHGVDANISIAARDDDDNNNNDAVADVTTNIESSAARRRSSYGSYGSIGSGASPAMVRAGVGAGAFAKGSPSSLSSRASRVSGGGIGRDSAGAGDTHSSFPAIAATVSATGSGSGGGLFHTNYPSSDSQQQQQLQQQQQSLLQPPQPQQQPPRHERSHHERSYSEGSRHSVDSRRSFGGLADVLHSRTWARVGLLRKGFAVVSLLFIIVLIILIILAQADSGVREFRPGKHSPPEGRTVFAGLMQLLVFIWCIPLALELLHRAHINVASILEYLPPRPKFFMTEPIRKLAPAVVADNNGSAASAASAAAAATDDSRNGYYTNIMRASSEDNSHRHTSAAAALAAQDKDPVLRPGYTAINNDEDNDEDNDDDDDGNDGDIGNGNNNYRHQGGSALNINNGGRGSYSNSNSNSNSNNNIHRRTGLALPDPPSGSMLPAAAAASASASPSPPPPFETDMNTGAETALYGEPPVPKSVHPSRVVELAGLLSALTFCGILAYAWVFADTGEWGDNPHSVSVAPVVVQFVVWAVVLLLLLLPWPCPLWAERKAILRVLAEALSGLLCYPLLGGRVVFFHVIVTDGLTSATIMLWQLEYAFCHFASSNWNNRLVKNSDGQLVPDECGSGSVNYRYVRPLIYAMPFWLRAMQCLFLYLKNSHLQGWPRISHLVNLGKYTVSLAVVFSSTAMDWASPKYYNSVRDFWILCLILKSIYCALWDIYMDWGLGRFQHRFLRQELVVTRRRWVYYLVIVCNAILRVSWGMAISPHFCPASCALGLGVAEIVRRGIWNIFRIEWEYLVRLSSDQTLAARLHLGVDDVAI